MYGRPVSDASFLAVVFLMGALGCLALGLVGNLLRFHIYLSAVISCYVLGYSLIASLPRSLEADIDVRLHCCPAEQNCRYASACCTRTHTSTDCAQAKVSQSVASMRAIGHNSYQSTTYRPAEVHGDEKANSAPIAHAVPPGSLMTVGVDSCTQPDSLTLHRMPRSHRLQWKRRTSTTRSGLYVCIMMDRYAAV